MMQETKDVVVLVARIGNGISKSLEDKTINIMDLPNFGPAAMAFPAAIANISNLPEEFKNGTDADREDLVDTFVKEFSISHAAAEIMVEKAIAVAVAIWNMIK